jgi:hypothetical protein
VIIWILLICLPNLFYMLILSMLMLIIISYMIELLKRSFKFILFLSMINLQMFLQNLSPLLLLLLLDSSFGLNPHPQLEGVYYSILCIKGLYILRKNLFLYCNLYINYCTLSYIYIYINMKCWLTNLLSFLLFSTLLLCSWKSLQSALNKNK